MAKNYYFSFAMKNKNHLTEIQRYQISALLQAGHTQKEISVLLGKDKSVISRELKRNSTKRGVYLAGHAQRLSEERKERFKRVRRFTSEIRDRVVFYLQTEQWSPCQIVGVAAREGIPMVSHETIYRFIRADKANGGTLFKHTRHGLKHRKRPASGKHVNIRNKISIDERPDIINSRGRFGDFEIDTIIGKDNKGAILTLTERKTKFLFMKKLEKGKEARGLAKEVVELLLPYKKYIHSITSDNGSEFAEHEFIARSLGIKFYFAHPYSSWERGLNENTNGLIRQYIPKGVSFDQLSELDIKNIQYKINRRPREKLQFDSPKNRFFLSLK